MVELSRKQKDASPTLMEFGQRQDRISAWGGPEANGEQAPTTASKQNKPRKEQEQKQEQEHEQSREREQVSASESQHSNTNKLTSKLKSFVHMVMAARKKENKLDSLEAMINESAMKLLQQKELVFRQQNCLQLDQLCKTTKFTRQELKWLYSGWKVACTDGCGVSTDAYFGGNESYGSHSLPSAYYGIINESQFQQIYAQFFPYGGDCSFYARYVFHAMFGSKIDDNGGFITFGDYAHALSDLMRGSVEDKINFVFRLYDLNGDDVLTMDELSRIFFAIYRLLGDNVNHRHDQMTYESQAEKFYRKIAKCSPQHKQQQSSSSSSLSNSGDISTSGAITKEQFMDYCIRDQTIVDTIKMLEMSILSSAVA